YRPLFLRAASHPPARVMTPPGGSFAPVASASVTLVGVIRQGGWRGGAPPPGLNRYKPDLGRKEGDDRQRPRRSRRSSRRSWRRLTPWETTAAVPTTAAVLATGR